MPHSISSYYIKLIIAASYESLDLDIPFEVQYLAKSNAKNSYQKQLKAYGLDLLIKEHENDIEYELLYYTYPSSIVKPI